MIAVARKINVGRHESFAWRRNHWHGGSNVTRFSALVCHNARRNTHFYYDSQSGIYTFDQFNSNSKHDQKSSSGAGIGNSNGSGKHQSTAQISSGKEHFHELFKISPNYIFNKLSQEIVGQANARRMVSAIVYNHFKRSYLNILNETRGGSRPVIKKSNAIFIGPTGSGKTNIATCIKNLLDIPTVIVDSTSYTQAGYVGQDIENIIEQLYQEANCDIFRTQNGIVFMDEIDKIAAKSSSTSSRSRDVGGEGVQQSLLKMIEGTTVQISDKPKKKTAQDHRGNLGKNSNSGSGAFKSNFNPFGAFSNKFGNNQNNNISNAGGFNERDFNIPGLHFPPSMHSQFGSPSGHQEVTIDTSNILFIGLGAFPGLTDIISDRRDTSSFGFDQDYSQQINSQERDKNDRKQRRENAKIDSNFSLLQNANVEDMRQFGFMAEFIGRFPLLVPFHELKQEHYRQILVNSKCGLLREYQKMLQLDNIALKFSDAFLECVADEAKALGIGARGLRTIIESKLMELLFIADVKKRYEVTLEKEGYMISEYGSKSSKFRSYTDTRYD